MFEDIDSRAVQNGPDARRPVSESRGVLRRYVEGLARRVTRQMGHYRQPATGMTLIEIMAVIAIIGLIMGIVAVGIVPRLRKAERKSAEIQIHNIEGALDQFRLDNGYYPGSDQGLKALVDKPTSGRVPRDYQEGGYLKGGKVPKDPWGNDYLYTSPGTQGNPYEIVSLGADGQEGGEGEDADIRSWEVNK